MVTQSPLEEARPDPETLAEPSTLQQPQATNVAELDATGPGTQQRLLQDIDLISPEETDTNVPPPAYGDVYGEIHNEKDGLGTSATVTDDGRVNIRINQLNRRLSQIFTPALRQQAEAAQDSQPPPPPPYIPPSLGGKDDIVPPPSLNIVIHAVGSRGDVQPFVALGRTLKYTYGHRVRLATHPNFKDFVLENDLEFFSIGGDPSRLMAFMVKNPSLMPGLKSIISGDVSQRRRDVGEYIQGCWRSCYEAGDGMALHATKDDLSEISNSDNASNLTARPFVADCIIANPPSFAHIHCAEKLGVPLHIMFTMPYSPTQAFPHPLANIQSSNADPQLTNFISYAMIELLAWQGLGDVINRFRKKCLALDPVSVLWAPGMLQRLKVPHTYCWSPALIPKPKDWGPRISISGFHFLKSSDYTPAAELQAFLEAGPTPIYIGFGSIVLEDPDAMTKLIFQAVAKTRQRVLLSKGWGGMGADRIPSGVFMLGNVPHDWLFKHVSCVVHHGGAGTTAAGIAAGRPTVIVPFFGDQPFWGSMVARAGAGPEPIPAKQLTADNLAIAINFCLDPDAVQRAQELAHTMTAEQGSEASAQSLHQHLEVDRLRCMLSPSRPATWRIKRTKVRLSAFAAFTLANAGLLDLHDLNLFRAQEYYTDEGPWDPVSGGFTAALRAFSGMAMGLADTPAETWKAVQLSSRARQRQSQESLPTSATESNTTDAATRSDVSERVQTGVDEPAFHSGDGGTSGPSPTGSKAGSSSTLDERQDNASLASRSRLRRPSEIGRGKHEDMLRQRVPHTSKGAGRFAKALARSPMELSVSFTQGFHNMPKLWGDETVRPQERVTDFKSGMKAVGREFGFGFYDGLTGLVTQPWKGAKKEGVGGFMKGVGKGIGGFVPKQGAAVCGILGHSMKGVYKEVEKLFGSDVNSYIIASRAAQGREEWLQSSDVEAQEVIARWELIQKLVKKKSADEMIQDVLEAQQKMRTEPKEGGQTPGPPNASAQHRTANFRQISKDLDGSESLSSPRKSNIEQSLEQLNTDEDCRPAARNITQQGARGDANGSPAIRYHASGLQSGREEVAGHELHGWDAHQAVGAGEDESQQHASELPVYEGQLNGGVAQILEGARQRSSDDVWELEDTSAQGGERGEVDRPPSLHCGIVRKSSTAQPGASSNYGPGQLLSRDAAHLEGTTQAEFEAQQQGRKEAKTTQERTEEEIVMAYVKKQSQLEAHHARHGKGSVTQEEDMEDAELRKALQLSMQER